MHRVVAALAITAIASGFWSGCGGANSGTGQASSTKADGAQTTASMTKAQFTAHFNDVCRHAWGEILKNAAEYSKWQSPHLSEKKNFARTVRYSFMAGFDFHIFNEIHALGAPQQQEHRGTTLIFTMKEAVEKAIHRLWLSTPARLAALFADYNRAARRYGLDDCLVAGSHLPHVEPGAPRASKASTFESTQRLHTLVERGGSDLHIKVVAAPPTIRLHGELTALEGHEPLSGEDTLLGDHLGDLARLVGVEEQVLDTAR